ncbi:MAG: MBL fold metallo-hydrolase [Candidatus Hermodarchaeia archaeon]
MTVTIKWLDHASFQIRSDTKVVYIDLGEDAKPTEKADVILVTHSHGDHCSPKLIKQAQTDRTVVVAPADCHQKIDGNVISLNPGEQKSVNDVIVRAVHAYNETRFRSPGNPFHPKGLGVGYLITLEGKTIYHAGDTDFISEMKNLGTVDVALLPIGGNYTMEAGDGADAALAINPRVAIPHHHWNGRFGQTPEAFKAKVEANSKIQVVVLKTNEEYNLG